MKHLGGLAAISQITPATLRFFVKKDRSWLFGLSDHNFFTFWIELTYDSLIFEKDGS